MRATLSESCPVRPRDGRLVAARYAEGIMTARNVTQAGRNKGRILLWLTILLGLEWALRRRWGLA